MTDNLIGQHRELIGTYGGAFSVITAHVSFAPAEGLDPRYQYATVLRDPVDRVISWLFFVIKNHDEEDLQDLFRQSERFVETEGEILGSELEGAISNLYTYHFSRILGSEQEDEDALMANSLAALECYDAIGIYEELPSFTNELGALIGIPAPEQLGQVNVTKSRPSIYQISAKLRDRIIELNQLDLKLYAAVQGMLRKRAPRTAPPSPAWTPLPPYQPRIHTSDQLTVHNVEMLTADQVREGEIMTFALDIELHREIPLLEAGIHIFDIQQRWAFGVNSSMLKQDYADMKPGRYRLLHHVVARLPVGHYTAGFAFANAAILPTQELYWQDAVVGFAIFRADKHPGVGYSTCPTRQTLWPTSGAALARDFSPRVQTHSDPECDGSSEAHR